MSQVSLGHFFFFRVRYFYFKCYRNIGKRRVHITHHQDVELIIRIAEYKPNYFSVMNSITRVYFFKKKKRFLGIKRFRKMQHRFPERKLISMYSKVTTLTKITSTKDHLDQMLFRPKYFSRLDFSKFFKKSNQDYLKYLYKHLRILILILILIGLISIRPYVKSEILRHNEGTVFRTGDMIIYFFYKILIRLFKVKLSFTGPGENFQFDFY